MLLLLRSKRTPSRSRSTLFTTFSPPACFLLAPSGCSGRGFLLPCRPSRPRPRSSKLKLELQRPYRNDGPLMNSLRQRFERSPELARLAPFAVYALLGSLQGKLGPTSLFWFYIAKTLAGAWMLWQVRPFVSEMRWAVSWEAIVVGVGIFALWVGLDGHYPRLSQPDAGANPFLQFGQGSALAWFYLVVHIAGMSIIVPPVEEIFYRSLVYRYLVKIDFRSMPLGQFHALS